MNLNGSQIGRELEFTCDVTMKRVPATIVAVEEQKVLHILSVCL
jgi:hypothetical protein